MNRLATKVARFFSNPDLLRVRLLSLLSKRGIRIKLQNTHRNNQTLNFSPVIWLRTPKCASSSIIDALEAANALVDLIRFPDTELTQSVLNSKVICISAGEKEWFISRYPEIWAKAFKWAVVRNPYERAVSAWQYMNSLKEKSLDDLLLNPPQQESGSEFHHFTRPFSSMLSVADEVVIDQIIRYEDLDASLCCLFQKLSIPFVGLPRVNITPGKRVRSADKLTVSQRQNIYRLYQDDFVNFGYPK